MGINAGSNHVATTLVRNSLGRGADAWFTLWQLVPLFQAFFLKNLTVKIKFWRASILELYRRDRDRDCHIKFLCFSVIERLKESNFRLPWARFWRKYDAQRHTNLWLLRLSFGRAISFDRGARFIR